MGKFLNLLKMDIPVAKVLYTHSMGYLARYFKVAKDLNLGVMLLRHYCL